MPIAIIEKLIVYSQAHLGLKDNDVTYVRNLLLNKLNEKEPFLGEINLSEIRGYKVPDKLIDELKEVILKKKIVEESDVDRYIVDVFGLITPLPSAVIDTFQTLYQKDKVKATDYLYDLQIKNNYIQKTQVEKNLYWLAKFEKNFLEITVNLSKPEKDNKDIAKLVKAEKTGYPACVLCKENLGFAGNDSHPARQNIRTIPLKLDGEPWFLQYSPYVYYDRHCIVIDETHEPMAVNLKNIKKLMAFVDQYPHFFIGSNSDLPIVGGSILNHEHFQGGAHRLPLMYASSRTRMAVRKHCDLRVDILEWYNSAILLRSRNRKSLLSAIDKIITSWRHYENPELDIISRTLETQHSTVTTIFEKKNGVYHAYIILRNNRANDTYPDGIFHAHPEHHPIKKEGIGLIEAMGLFILPARLKRQIATINQGIINHQDTDEIIQSSPDLASFVPLIQHLQSLGEKEDYEEDIKQFINETCRQILENVAVFKNDETGQNAFHAFMRSIDL